MKRFCYLALFIGLAIDFHAQSPLMFPWNPDQNGDAHVGVTDLTGFLSVYGSQFSNTLQSTDGSVAFHIADNPMSWAECNSYCYSLEGPWELISQTVAIENLSEVQTLFPLETFGSEYFWVQSSPTTPKAARWEEQSENDYGLGFNWTNASAFGPKRTCACMLEERPRIEYSFCYLEALPGNVEEFQECAELKANGGWYPLGGVAQDYGRIFQAFWRWAE